MNLVEHAQFMLDTLPQEGSSKVKSPDERRFYSTKHGLTCVDVLDGPLLLSVGFDAKGTVHEAFIYDREALLKSNVRAYQTVQQENIQAFTDYVCRLCFED